MRVDFHSHSNLSDGSLPPQELADFMGERGVEAFCISDHDTLGAYGRFDPPEGAVFVTGVEINTTWRGNEVHILGYGVPLGPSEINDLLEFNRKERSERAAQMVEQLRRGGYGITMDDVLAEADGAHAIGRPHVAKALVRKGISDGIDSAFRDLLRAGKAGHVPQHYTNPRKAIECIAAAGGLPVLAHPGRLKDRHLIDELAGQGLGGLEVFYPRHDAAEVAEFRAKAKEHGLVMTGGMDFHDIRYHTEGVGIDVADEDIAPFLERMGLVR